MNWPGRIYRALLGLLPSEFRREYADEMVTVFLDQHGRTRGWQRIRLWADRLADLGSGAAQEHFGMFLDDLRMSLRRLRSQPGFAAAAVLSLALGVGANAAIYSVLRETMLRPVSLEQHDRVVMMWSRNLQREGWNSLTPADVLDVREQARSFQGLEMMTEPTQVTIGFDSSFPERLRVQSVTPGFFSTMRIRPVIGRQFTAEDALNGDEGSVMISERMWRRKFGGTEDVIGKTFHLDGRLKVISGVMPDSFDMGWLTQEADVWGPIDTSPGSNWIQRQVAWVMAAGRLKDGVSLEAANAEVAAIAKGLAEQYPKSNRDLTFFVEPVAKSVASRWEEIALPLVTATGFVLLIACANIASLLLARAAARRRELSLRAALGAPRSRLIRELLSDSFALAVPGVAAAIAVAWAVLRFLVSLIPDPRAAEQFRISAPVLAFSAAAALAATFAAGLAPAILASRAQLSGALEEGSRGAPGRFRAGLRKALVTVEIAMAAILLTGAGLMIATSARLRQVPLGFDPSGLVAANLDLSAGDRYVKMAPRREIDTRFVEPPVLRFYEQLLEEARALPGVESAAIAAGVPLLPGGTPGAPFRIIGRPAPADGKTIGAVLNSVTPGYFELVRIPVLRGRSFTAEDAAGSQWTAVVNQAFASRYFPGEDPVGQTIQLDTTEFEQPRRIVGVTGDTKRFSPRVAPPPEIFMTFAQQPRLIRGNHQSLRLRPRVLVRTPLGAGAIGEELRRIANKIDPKLPVFDSISVAEAVQSSYWLERFLSRLLGLFAGLALFLAAAGIFALMHYSVADRIQEIGIRVALGASRRDVLRLVITSGMTFAVAGAAIGVAGSFAGAKLLARMLFGVGPADPVALGTAIAVLLAAALAACYIPARRAMAVDPVRTLRAD